MGCHKGTYKIMIKETIMFEELINRLTKIEDSILLLVDLHLQQTNNLTTYSSVSKFLGVSTRTIYNYIKESKLVQDKHYTINSNGKTIFIPKAIVEFKHRALEPQSIKTTHVAVNRSIHPAASKILQGVAS